jgi:glycosyltransferase involved in cell wall biosynthesis
MITMQNKILVIGQLPPPIHGSNIMAQIFLESLGRNGVKGGIVQKKFSKKNDEVGKVSLGKLFKVFPLFVRLFKSVKEEKPDLCVYFITVGLSAFLIDSLMIRVLRHFKIPYVLYFHGAGYLKYAGHSVALVSHMVKDVLSSSCGGMILGEGLKEDVRMFIPENRLFILPNTVPDMNPDRRMPTCPDGNPVRIVFLANLDPSKGPMEFLHMAKMLIFQERNVKFILAGNPHNAIFSDQLRQFILQEGLQDYVDMPGGIYGSEKAALFGSSDIFVYPTQKDAFPLVNLEAMQWGIPIITSPIGAIPEAVLDGINGYIVNPRNIQEIVTKVLMLVHNPKLRSTMGMAGRKLYDERYSISAYDKHVKNALEFFLTLSSEG